MSYGPPRVHMELHLIGPSAWFYRSYRSFLPDLPLNPDPHPLWTVRSVLDSPILLARSAGLNIPIALLPPIEIRQLSLLRAFFLAVAHLPLL